MVRSARRRSRITWIEKTRNPPSVSRGGLTLARPVLLPTGRIPFQEPPCPGRQVGEGVSPTLDAVPNIMQRRQIYKPSSGRPLSQSGGLDRAARFGERMYRICWQTIFISGRPQWYGKPLTPLRFMSRQADTRRFIGASSVYFRSTASFFLANVNQITVKFRTLS